MCQHTKQEKAKITTIELSENVFHDGRASFPLLPLLLPPYKYDWDMEKKKKKINIDIGFEGIYGTNGRQTSMARETATNVESERERENGRDLGIQCIQCNLFD